MVPFAFVLVSAILPHTSTFEITSNKPFVQVTVDGSAPQWFVLDTGCRGNSILAREAADRLGVDRGAEENADVGAGSGAAVGLAQAKRVVLLAALGDTMTVAQPLVLTLGHVSRVEGRPVDGLLGGDFLSTHVVEIDYAKHAINVRRPEDYVPPKGGVVVSLSLDTGWPVAEGTLTMPGGKPLPCRLLIDTGVRNTVTFFRPFSERHQLHDDAGKLRELVTGFGVGGVSRGDVRRAGALTLGGLKFPEPVVTFSRDTSGVLAMDGPDAILGGEILRRHRVTFDYPHERMILEPYDKEPAPFEFDRSGLFLAADPPDYARIRILSVHPGTPAAEAKLHAGDEIVAIDGKQTPALGLDEARALFRSPGVRSLEIRRGDQLLQVRVEGRRLV